MFRDPKARARMLDLAAEYERKAKQAEASEFNGPKISRVALPQPSASCASRTDPMLVLKRGGVKARAMILKLALATATDAGAVAYCCPAWTRSAMGDRCGAVR